MATVKMKYRGGGEIVVDESIVSTLALQGYSRADGKPIKLDDAPAVKAPRRTGTGTRTTSSTSASTSATGGGSSSRAARGGSPGTSTGTRGT